MFFTRKDSPEVANLKKAINTLMLEMENFSGDDEEYNKMANQLQKLFGLLAQNEPKGPSADTLLIVSGNLLTALLVVSYESKNVVTTKVLGFLQKIR